MKLRDSNFGGRSPICHPDQAQVQYKFIVHSLPSQNEGSVSHPSSAHSSNPYNILTLVHWSFVHWSNQPMVCGFLSLLG
ncbi:hypothetical protein IQ268_12805 [Oculatella sp. LEGE 06141]|uniref:hypothetical protein n=1 Tax=Oculatella sp. LEGE 06141 TaxID=1828648 RepID=UPI00188146F5|nr:hypothetical protein [Oculatella sp. LEGE 06141]MBE9179443.1 hypothetical protein [Oculatella sp. LEGE 06141]